jgi:hypothetical protein
MGGANTLSPNVSTPGLAASSEHSGGRGISRSSSVSTVVYVGTPKNKQPVVGSQTPSSQLQLGASSVEKGGDSQEEHNAPMGSSSQDGL